MSYKSIINRTVRKSNDLSGIVSHLRAAIESDATIRNNNLNLSPLTVLRWNLWMPRPKVN